MPPRAAARRRARAARTAARRPPRTAAPCGAARPRRAAAIARVQARRRRQRDEQRLQHGIRDRQRRAGGDRGVPRRHRARPRQRAGRRGAAVHAWVSAPPVACSRAKRSAPAGSTAPVCAPPQRAPRARDAERERRGGAERDRGDRAVESGERIQRQCARDDHPVLQRIAQAPGRRALEAERELRQQRGRRAQHRGRADERDMRAVPRRPAPATPPPAAATASPPSSSARVRPMRSTSARATSGRPRPSSGARTRANSAGPPIPVAVAIAGRHRQRDREAAVVGRPERARHEQHERSERQRLERLARGAGGQRLAREHHRAVGHGAQVSRPNRRRRGRAGLHPKLALADRVRPEEEQCH